MKNIDAIYENFKVEDFSAVDPKGLAAYHKKNFHHLARSMPLKNDEFFTDQYWKGQQSRYVEARDAGTECRWILADNGKVFGTIVFDQIIKGPLQACCLGYGIDKDYEGLGLMKKALKLSISALIKEHDLNRIMANYEPSNIRSGNLLKSLGFEREGYARKYLRLNGEWKDHILTSLIMD